MASALASARRAGAPRTGLQELGLIAVVLILGTMIALDAPLVPGRNGKPVNSFLRADNLVSIGTDMAITGVMAIGMTPVIVAGGIDISVGSICALAALGTVAVLQNPRFLSAPFVEVVPLGLAVGCGIGLACGLINGLLIVGLRLHPFIVTLGTLSIFRGIATVSVPLKTLPVEPRAVPPNFAHNFFAWTPTGYGEMQPVPMVVMLFWMGLIWFFLSLTVGGRETYAVGSNEEAARFSGISVGRVKLVVFGLAGLAAGLAGAINAGQYASASSDTAEGYELQVIAAAVVGGASLSGGRGTALGALLGMLIIELIENGISVLRYDQEFTKIIVGASIIVAVAVDRMLVSLRARRVGAPAGAE